MEQIKNILITLFCSIALVSNASTADSLFTAANTAYQAKQYLQAIQLYEAIALENKHSCELYYNLGNSYYQEGAIAMSILNYERALLLNPQDEKTHYNLTVAKERIEQIEPLPTLFFEKWWKQFYSALSLKSWSILLLIALWTNAALAILFLRKKKKHHFQTLLLSLACSLLLFMSYQQSKQENKKRYAIALNSETLKQSPSLDARNAFPLPLGNKVQIIEEQNDWALILLSDGNQAWIQLQSLIEI